MRHINSHIFITSISFVVLYRSFSCCSDKVNFVLDCCIKGRLQFGEWIKCESVIYVQPIKSNLFNSTWNSLQMQDASSDLKKQDVISLGFVIPHGRIGLSYPKKPGLRIIVGEILL